MQHVYTGKGAVVVCALFHSVYWERSNCCVRSVPQRILGKEQLLCALCSTAYTGKGAIVVCALFHSVYWERSNCCVLCSTASIRIYFDSCILTCWHNEGRQRTLEHIPHLRPNGNARGMTWPTCLFSQCLWHVITWNIICDIYIESILHDPVFVWHLWWLCVFIVLVICIVRKYQELIHGSMSYLQLFLVFLWFYKIPTPSVICNRNDKHKLAHLGLQRIVSEKKLSSGSPHLPLWPKTHQHLAAFTWFSLP